jgi:hypothetical protein
VTLGQDTVPERITYAREPSKLPVVLSADEVVRFLEAIPSLKSRTALTTVYAAGRARSRPRRSREPLEPTRDVAVQYLHQRDGPPLLEVELHGLPIDESDAAQHVTDGGEPGDRRRIDVLPLAA